MPKRNKIPGICPLTMRRNINKEIPASDAKNRNAHLLPTRTRQIQAISTVHELLMKKNGSTLIIIRNLNTYDVLFNRILTEIISAIIIGIISIMLIVIDQGFILYEFEQEH
jgi:hypothetical protein